MRDKGVLGNWKIGIVEKWNVGILDKETVTEMALCSPGIPILPSFHPSILPLFHFPLFAETMYNKKCNFKCFQELLKEPARLLK